MTYAADWAIVSQSIVGFLSSGVTGSYTENGLTSYDVDVVGNPADLALLTNIKTQLETIYLTSAAARTAINAAVGWNATTNTATKLLEIGQTNTGSWASGVHNLVTIDTAQINSLHYINDKGVLVQEIPVLSIIHEIIHAAGGLGLPDVFHGGAYSDGSDAFLNQLNVNQRGPTVDMQNTVALQMGYTSNVQAGYGATGHPSSEPLIAALNNGQSWSEGNTVDFARFGDQPVRMPAGNWVQVIHNTIDHSSNTTMVRDLIFGFTGVDIIRTGLGNDYVYGGDDNDIIEGGDGDDKLHGENGEDTIEGGEGHDRLFGDDLAATTPQINIDTLYGDAGNDTLVGGGGDDVLNGGADNDDAFGGDDNDTIDGGAGDDELRGEDGTDTLRGGADNDEAFGGDDTDTIEGGDGNDELHGEDGLDFLFGGGGNDDLFGDDLAAATPQVNNDRLFGEAGNDTLAGGFGNDILDGGADVDTLMGNEGNDRLRSGSGSGDTLFGGAGHDVLIAQGSVVHLYGDDGSVTGGSAIGDGGADHFVAGGGQTFIHDADGDDRLYWGNDLASMPIFGGVQQFWMEGGFAAWTPFTSSLFIFPMAAANLLAGLMAGLIDATTSSMFQFYRTDSNQLVVSVLFGRLGQIVIEDYQLDLATGAASANVVAFRQVWAPEEASKANFVNYLNLALRAGFGSSLLGVDPLILDLDGDGIELSGGPTTYFDLNGDGWAERTVWVRGGDGFLVRDINTNGQIDNIGEMFGDETTPGFSMLASLDSNSDGKISALDAGFSTLRVWVDADGDGHTDAGELRTLGELDIVEISLTTSGGGTNIRGNAVRAEATFTRGDASTGTIADLILQTNPTDTRWLGDTTISSAAAALPELKAFGLLTNLRIAMTDDATLLSNVTAFASMSASSDWTTITAAVEDILFRWAGVDGVAATAMGADFDRQKLAFLEKWFGTEMAPRDGSGNPLLINVGELIDAWNGVLEEAAIKLAAQGPLEGVLTGIEYDLARDRLEADGTGTLASIIATALDDLPASAGPALAEWNDHWAPLISALAQTMVRSDGNLVRADYIVQNLITALDGVTQPLTMSELVSGLGLEDVVLGSAGADTLNMGGADSVVFVSSAGNDTINGTGGQAVFVYGEGFGQDTIIDTETREVGDRIRFSLHSQDDVTFTRAGFDLVISINGSTDKITIRDQFRKDIGVQYGIEEIQFADGAILDINRIMEILGRGTAAGETLTGTAFEDILEGGGGNDTLRGGDGGDVYLFSAGDGQDTIEDVQTTPMFQSADILAIEDGYYFDDIIFTRDGDSDDLLITFAGSSDQILIVDQFDYNALGVRGANGAEGIIGLMLNNPFINGTNLALESRMDSIVFGTGGAFSWLDIQQILIEQNTTDGVDITYGFGTADTFAASAGNDLLIGHDGSDTYGFDIGSGDDVIEDQTLYLTLLGTDTVVFGEGITAEDLIFSRPGSAPDLFISIEGTSDTLTIRDQFDGQKMDLFGLLGIQWFDRIEKFVFSDGSSLTWEQVLAMVTTGMAGNDALYGDFYADVMNGGAGNDYLNGGDHGDTYVFGLGDGQDTIEDTPGYAIFPAADILLFEAGIAVGDVIFEHIGESRDLRVSIAGTDDFIIIVDQYRVLETGPFGAQAINQIELFRWADGTTKTFEVLIQEIIDAAKTSGDDLIVGSHFNDSIDGGAGNDTFKGGNGADTYVFTTGYGDDTINDFASNLLAEDGDQVVFGAGIGVGDITIERSGEDDVILHINGTSDSLTIEGQFNYDTLGNRTNEVESFAFDGGPVWTAEDLREQYLLQMSTAGADTIEGFWSDDEITGGAGNDTLRGEDGSDTYVFAAGFGNDAIEETVHNVFYDDVDALVFASGLDSTDAIFSRSGDDLIIGFTGSSDTVTVVGQFDHVAYFAGWTDIEQITFGDSVTLNEAEIRQRLLEDASTSGADTIEAFYTADVLDGGAGNDTLIGRGGGDTYHFGVGGGQDVIQESFGTVYEDRPDTVVFDATVARVDVTFTRVGDDLVAVISGATDTLTIDNHFLSNGQGRVELFRFADGTTITAAQAEANAIASLSTPGADIIAGGSGADLLDGGAGNDTLRGAQGSDTYVFGRGYGQDLIEENGGSSGSPNDRVVFGEGIALSDLVFSRSGDDLIIDVAGTSDRLTIDMQFYSAASTGVWSRYRVDTFEFADGSILSGVEIDALTLAAHQTSGNDTILGFTTVDRLDGGAGNDFMRGDAGDDTYVFGVGYGHDVINETTQTHGDLDDAIIFAGLNAEDVVLSRDGEDAIITIAATGDTLTLEYQFRSADSSDVFGADRLERFVFADGTVWTATDFEDRMLAAQQTAGNDVIQGYHRPDILDGGAGNDSIQGNDGNDTYIFGRGYGQDSILETTETHGDLSDSILFTDDVAPEDIQFARSGHDLIISIVGTTDTLTIRYQFLSHDSSLVDGNDRIENFVFADGTIWTARDVELMTLEQSSTSGADVITGYGTVDVIDGGAGNDTLRGNGSSDTYVFGRGYGHDSINETSDTYGSLSDTIRFTEDVVPSDILLSRDSHDLIISIAGTDDELRIQTQLWSTDSTGAYGADRVEYFVFSDGTVWTATEVEARLLAQEATAGADVIEGFDSADRIEGLGGNDTLNGREGTDTLLGQSGDDLLIGGTGADTIDGGDGADTVSYTGVLSFGTIDLSNSANNTGVAAGDILIDIENVIGAEYGDTITGNALANRIDGGDGTDTLNGGDGDDTLIGGKLGDVLNGGSGTDTASYSTTNGAVIAYLANAVANTGWAAGDTYSSIENLIGTNFHDTLGGDGNANDLDGGGNNDILIGNAGADRLNGNSGTDTASYVTALAGLVVSLANTAINTGDAVGDVYVSIENLTGSGYADTLTGDSANNSIDGGAGDDVLIGGAGADTLIGNSGTDTASYAAAAAGIIVSLTTTSGSAGEAQGDSFNAVENLTGSAFADTMTGSTGANTLDGGGGDDWLTGGAGADAYIGGDGADTASYNGTAVIASLASPGGNTGDAAGDTYTGIENLSGSSSNDTLTGDTGANLLQGWNGADTLSGGDGDDFLFGGSGADAMTGGNGSDTVTYTGGSSLSVNLANAASNSGSEASGDTYTSIENIVTAGGHDTLTGTSGANRLNGGSGNDTLIGGAGADELIGDIGTDTANYAAAAAGLVADMSTPANNTGDAQGDTYNGVENVTGSAFADTLGGNSGANNLDGGNGDDVLIGGAGADLLTGGSGTDTASYATAAAGVLANLGSAGANTGDAAGDTYSAIENLLGSNYGDTLTGSSSANTIWGGDGADFIAGAVGLDTLYGGSGADTFVYNATSESAVGANADRIMDFTQGSDIINLTAIDAITTVGGNQDFTFIGSGAFTNTAGQVRAVQSGSDIVLTGDTNGDGTADFQIVIVGVTATLTVGDFGL